MSAVADLECRPGREVAGNACKLCACNSRFRAKCCTAAALPGGIGSDLYEPECRSVASDVRFEAFTAVTMKNGVFWDVMPCGSCKNRRFGEP
jgi:hypothetical protein